MNNRYLQTQNFLDYCRFGRRLSPETIRAYFYDLKHFNRFLDNYEAPIEDFSQVEKGTLDDYLHTLDDYSVKTIKHKFACIRSLYNFLTYDGKISHNPFSQFHLNLREPYKVRTAMTLEEMTRFLHTAYKEKPDALRTTYYDIPQQWTSITSEEFIWVRDMAIFELLFASGIRVSELCNIKFENINDYHMTIMIYGKGNKERLIYLEHDEVISSFNTYLLFRKQAAINLPYVFITKFGQKLSTQAVRNLVTKYTTLADINKNITPHSFRHTFATLLLEEGVDIKYIQDFLGHSSISTTQLYLHTTNQQKKRIMATQHPRHKIYLSGNPPLDNVKLTSRGGGSNLSLQSKMISPQKKIP